MNSKAGVFGRALSSYTIRHLGDLSMIRLYGKRPFSSRLVIAAVFSALAGSVLYAWIPDPGLYPELSQSTAIFDSRDRLIRLTLNSEDAYRLFVPIEEIPKDMIDATLLYEDRFFYRHPGVNPCSIVRALCNSIILKGRLTGASTITMQTARMRFSLKTTTIPGKIIQILRALQLERHYSKERILEAYFNLAPYGRNIEGIGAAGLIYFGKRPMDLSFPEALSLAVIPQNPSARCPSDKSGYIRMDEARQALFQRYVAVNPSYAKDSGLMSLPLACGSPETIPFKAPHFADYVLASQSVAPSGAVKTSLDLDLQDGIQAILSRHVKRRNNDGIKNAAALLIDTRTMSILSMAGSVDFFNSAISGQVNAATAKRSPGSALKPFVYALALDQGLIHPMTLLKDTPLRYGAYTPENFDGTFQGPLSATQALIRSRNVPALTLAGRLEDPDFYGFLKMAGISKMKDRDFYGLSLVLGGGEVSMIEMSELYAMLANGGVMKGVQFSGESSFSGIRLLSPEACYLVLDMLMKNPSPDQEFADEDKNSMVAWKTGTSWGFRDAWAAGVINDLALVVWVGDFTGAGNPSFVGRNTAGPIFFDILSFLRDRTGALQHPGPDINELNLEEVTVCAVSGGLPNCYTPKTVKTWFIPGVSPITVSTIHRAIAIDVKTGLRACCSGPPYTRDEVFEFWPSDISKIFHEAGIYRPEPPAFMEDCDLEDRDEKGMSPQIISPDSAVTYILRNDGAGGDRVPLEATAENGVKTLYWFADNAYIGQSRPSDIFLWEADAGRFQIRAVDDNGRVAIKTLTVMRE
ncbi:MAG: penicillin-binding protein 1C [Deltaproteobacteria bacterium]|nr:penicillin-binding protein 1C [Deltaproteobacteria bacterium]